MKDFIIYGMLVCLFLFFIFGCWLLGKTINYKLSYEDMVKETCRIEIQKVLK